MLPTANVLHLVACKGFLLKETSILKCITKYTQQKKLRTILKK
jgi:hypothetical protein